MIDSLSSSGRHGVLLLGIVVCVLGGVIFVSVAAEPKPEAAAQPKYGSQAVRLFHAREYLQTHEAPDFWALMPYYVHQFNERACSVASATMVVNALRLAGGTDHDRRAYHPGTAAQAGLQSALGQRCWPPRRKRHHRRAWRVRARELEAFRPSPVRSASGARRSAATKGCASGCGKC